MLNRKVVLNNGVEMPVLGFGTFLTPSGEVCENSVKRALEYGYRHIDTAKVYENEADVGRAVAESGIDRNEIFITTKLWNTEHGYDNALRAFDRSLTALGTDYADLYLIHWPIAFANRHRWQTDVKETWKAFERLYREKRVRAIGVSNFLVRHLKYLFDNCEIAPMVDQIECHIGYPQRETVEYAAEFNLAVEAWSPLCKGRYFDNEKVKEVAQETGRTPAQVMIRWCLQHNLVALPKSVTPSRIAENALVFDFELSRGQMAVLDAIPESDVGRLGSHPDNCMY